MYKKIHFILYQCHYKINNKLTIIFSAKEQKETKALWERNHYAGIITKLINNYIFYISIFGVVFSACCSAFLLYAVSNLLFAIL
jgi:hypothetical protein